MAVGAVVARIITQYSDKGSKAAKKDIANLGKSFDDFGQRVTRSFALATAAVGAFAVKVGKDAVSAAIADQKSQALLANSLRNTVGATNAAIASVEGYISKLQLQVGVADDELRPALSRLAAVTGDVSSAQKLLSTALDISAFSGADLTSSTKALIKGLSGSFRGLQTLVPGLDAAAIKGKNFAKVLGEVEQITSGAAATRANTLEYRLAILRIRYSEILETLGYQLIPVVERFAKIIETKVLPQVEAWIQANGTKLVAAFQAASNAAVTLIGIAISFSEWIANNMGLVKTMAGLIAGMFIVGKIAAFATAIQTLATGFAALRTAAAGAAIATAFATGGTSVIAATAALAAVGGAAAIYAGLKTEGNKVRGRKAKLEAGLGGYTGSPGAGDVAGFTSRSLKIKTPTVDSSMSNYLDFLKNLQKEQDKLNKKKEKELTVEQKIINAMLKKYGLTLMTSKIEAQATAASIAENLNRQRDIAKSSPTVSLAAQGDGSAAGTGSIMNSNTPQLTVNITTPYGTKDDFFVDIDANLKTLRRRAGRTPSGFTTGIGIE